MALTYGRYIRLVFTSNTTLLLRFGLTDKPAPLNPQNGFQNVILSKCDPLTGCVSWQNGLLENAAMS